MSPRAINRSNLIAVIGLSLTLFAWIIGSAVIVQGKADAVDVAKNAEDIAVLRAQEDVNQMAHMRIEAKVDKIIDHLIEGDH